MGCAKLGLRAGLLTLAVGCVLVLALTACSRPLMARGAVARQRSTAAVPPEGVAGPAGSTFTLMQMNLCLSGLASCYGKVAYPAVLDEAIAQIRQARPDAVTINEACGNDVALIARWTGYHLSFSRVIYGGKPLPCVRPGGRGLFGDAVLTERAVERADSRAFAAQEGIERRRWLCVAIRVDLEACTAHLNTLQPAERAGNAAQCAELAALLARRAAARTVIFGGDVNRWGSCAPAGFWTRADSAARQDPGLQQVYGSSALQRPSAGVVPATHSDHDILLVRAYLGARRPR